MKIDTLAGGGFVRLVDVMGNDLSIVRSARVSYDADWRTGDDEKSDAKLIRSLMRRHHTSPFEAVQFTFEIKCPIFIARQWHRHRTWSYNEVSARYAELDEGYYVPLPEHLGVQHATEKQARDLEATIDVEGAAAFCAVIDRSCERTVALYRHLLEHGVPRELARSVLPVAAYTRFFGTVNLHNLFHFLRLRLDGHAQYEIRVYAEAMLALIAVPCPVAVAAFKEDLDREIGRRKFVEMLTGLIGVDESPKDAVLTLTGGLMNEIRGRLRKFFGGA